MFVSILMLCHMERNHIILFAYFPESATLHVDEPHTGDVSKAKVRSQALDMSLGSSGFLHMMFKRRAVCNIMINLCSDHTLKMQHPMTFGNVLII